ncbi:MAG: ribosome small subunit-dependent GTPase A, partial [Ruminiclostridium sp.]|nr:ribosome small subunit-dependent GTPase A [Ruminiclostridium sp.]
VEQSTYIADTPGFSTVEISKYGAIPSRELAENFREFGDFLDRCRFKDCAHIKEEGCVLREAVREGRISSSRYDSYCKLFAEAVKEENGKYK